MLIVSEIEVDIMNTANVKEIAHQLIDQLPEDANWDKVIYTLQMRRDIDAGMADIEAGRVIEGEKIIEWLESWGMDNELEPPTI